MATTVNVNRSCGHTQAQDMGTRKPFEVEGFTRFLQGRPCRTCDPAYRKKTEARAAQARRERDQEAIAAETRAGLPPLDGRSEMAISWARQVRLDMVGAAFELLVETATMDTEEFDDRITDRAGRVTDASWWIDRRELNPSDLEQSLIAALGDPNESAVCENPF